MMTKFFDQRTVRKSIENGVTKEEDFNKFLKSLPDEASLADEVPYKDEDDLRAEAEEQADLMAKG